MKPRNSAVLERKQTAMANLTLVQAINLALIQEMEADDRVVILGEDVGKNGGVFRVTEGLHQRFGDERVVDTPLAESGIIGTSIGLAMAGLRPIPEIQFEGKPQCHIIPIAYEQGRVAVSVGCMLSRVRTGMPSSQLTCAIPARRLQEVVAALEAARGADDAVARYAAEDKRRFES